MRKTAKKTTKKQEAPTVEPRFDGCSRVRPREGELIAGGGLMGWVLDKVR